MRHLRITLTGPCSPADVSSLLDERYQDETQAFIGQRSVAVSTLAKELVALGYVVSVVTTANEISGAAKLFTGHNFALRVVPRRSRFRERALSFYKMERQFLLEEIKKSQPDLVHAHWTNEYALAALKSNHLVLVTARDAPLTIFLRYSLTIHSFLQLLMSLHVRMKVENLSAVSTYLAKRWRKEMLWRKRIVVIPNGVPMSIIPKSEVQNSEKYVVALGDEGKRKNIRNLVLAWPMVLEHHPDAQLLLCGSGLDPDSNLAKEFNGLDEYRQIIWHGYVERRELEELFTNSMIQVHASLEESLGNAVLEGMAKGLAIVAGKSSGAISEVLGDSALLVDVSNPREIAEAVIKLLDEPELRAELGQRANIRVREQFTPLVMANRFLDEYRNILSQRGS